jgi:hypothetical protein
MQLKNWSSALDTRNKVEPVEKSAWAPDTASAAAVARQRDVDQRRSGRLVMVEESGGRGRQSVPPLSILCDSAARIRQSGLASRRLDGCRSNLRPSFAAVAALVLLCGAGGVLFGTGPASASEITGLITKHDVTIARMTLSNGMIFSVPPSFLADVTKVGSVVRVTYENYGEYDNEVQVTNIELVCNDSNDPFCSQFRNVQ